MSTWSLLDDKECWQRIEALLEKVPDEANRKLIKKDSRSRKAGRQVLPGNFFGANWTGTQQCPSGDSSSDF